MRKTVVHPQWDTIDMFLYGNIFGLIATKSKLLLMCLLVIKL